MKGCSILLLLPYATSYWLSFNTKHPLPSRRPPIVCVAGGFGALGVREDVTDALATLGITAPNELQSKAIPILAGRASVILGAQTGSGKTLTYLLPIMQNLKIDEEARGGRGRPRRPHAIVLLPTRELSLQVRDVSRSLSKQLKLSVASIHGGVPDGPQKRQLDMPIDLLVATPGRLVHHLERGNVFLGSVRYVVLDEVDTMFEAGFGGELDQILSITTRNVSADKRTEGGQRVQHLAVGATHPEAALALYKRWLSGAQQLLLANHHSLPATLDQRFISCSADAKMPALRELLGPPDEHGRPSLGRVVLFCNSQQSARFVDHSLVEEGYATSNYHGAVPANTRAANFETFCAGGAHVLVTTDLAARGLDKLDVAHVVHFDFPKSASDYVHRCGRTARAGARGTVHSLVTKHDAELVRAIRAANKAGKDVVMAGDEQKRIAKQRGLIEFKSARPEAMATFPTSYGLSSPSARKKNARGKKTP
ncbi:hypothetical protein AB1Y20_012165 [Prymnesium parvum]|uniref:RNA helicase n=1 Tax=Prymnesium parvum TaxID=97485 RepID=A0AB34INR8_PRYPA